MTDQAAGKVLSEFDRSINLALDKRINRKVQFTVKGRIKYLYICSLVFPLLGKIKHVSFL